MVEQIPDIYKFIDKNVVKFQNNSESELEYPMSVLDNAVILKDGSQFPLENGVLRIGDEFIFYKKRSGNIFSDITRGYCNSHICLHSCDTKVIAPCIADTINMPKDFIFSMEKFIGLQCDLYDTNSNTNSLFAKISYIKNRWGKVHANFISSKRCGVAPLMVQFKDVSTGEPLGWKWDFGDGSTSFEKDPMHIYAEPGTYDVSLITYSTANSSVLKSQYIQVFTNETINSVVFYVKQIINGIEAYGMTGNRGAQFKFICQSDGPIASRFWDFGDGSQPIYINDPNLFYINYTYNYAGKFFPTLTISGNGKTCKKQMEDPIIILKN